MWSQTHGNGESPNKGYWLGFTLYYTWLLFSVLKTKAVKNIYFLVQDKHQKIKVDSEAANLAIFWRSYQTSILHWMYDMPLEEEMTVLLILPPNSEG